MSSNLGPKHGTMKALVIHEAGGPEVFRVEERVVPVPVGNWTQDRE